jgi:MATE family multidrug resistance protein
MSQFAAIPVTHRSILRIALPIMLSNVSEPLIGVVNTAVVGQLPQPYFIGAITVGSLIFSFLFWGFGFLRLSTGGLTAQAVGAGDRQELAAVLARALLIAAAIGIALLLLSPLLRDLAFTLVGGSADVRMHGETYFNWRIWSAPFALVNFSLMGWFIGRARTRYTLVVQLLLNLTNMALSALFVLVLHWESAGVGLAALLAEIIAAVTALAIARHEWRRLGLRIDRARILDAARLRSTLAMNSDVMIRTLSLLFAFGWFTARGARAGDLAVAVNAVLMNFFNLAAYLIDGFASASETLVGQSIGAGDRPRYRAAVWLTSLWAVAVGSICSLLILVAGPALIDVMTVNPEIRAVARHYLGWAALAPFLGTFCFQFDGIFTGALATRDMRNMMLVSLALFMAAWALLEPRFGNHGLWAALNIFFVARGLTFASRMPSIEQRAFR